MGKDDLWDLVDKEEITCKLFYWAGAATHKQYLTFLFLERASPKYEEFFIDLENDWLKKIDSYPIIVNEAYTLLKTSRSSDKFILSIVQRSKRNDRSNNNNSNFKTNSGLSFNQDKKCEQQHIQDNKEETQSCFKCKE